MIRSIKLLLTICITAVITSCSYEFSTDNFIDIAQPEQATNLIELNNFKNLDVINIESQLTYIFTAKKNQFLRESLLYIDGKEFGITMNGNIGTFGIYPFMYEDGVHTIKLISKYSSGTGSIADQNQTEIITYIKEIQFVVHRKPSAPPEITEATIKDGSIFLKWSAVTNPEYMNAFLRLKFKTKEIRIPLTKEMLDQGYYVDKKTVLHGASPNSSNFDEYKEVNYSIVFASPYVELAGSSKGLSYDPSWISLKMSYVNDSSYKIHWSTYPLYANITGIEIKTRDLTFLATSTGGELIINKPYVLGQDYWTYTIPRAITEQYSLDYLYSSDTSLDEETFGVFPFKTLYSGTIVYNPSTNKNYALIIEINSQNVYEIYIYEYSTKMVFIKKKFIAEFKSPRYEKIKLFLDPILNNLFIDTSTSSYTIDKLNLNIIASHVSSDINDDIDVKNNILRKWNYWNLSLSLSNLQNNVPIYTGTSITPGYLSRDGKYACIFKQNSLAVYRITNDQLVKVIDILPSIRIEIENDILYYSNGFEVYIVNLITKTSKSFTTNWTDSDFKLDYVSNKILLYQNGNALIYDITTQRKTPFTYETTKSNGNPYSQLGREYVLNLQNGKLIHSKGIYININ